jgi:iron complex outermembrane receptor protein
VAGGQLIDLEQRLDTADLLTLEDGTAQGAPQLVADRVAKTQAQSAALFADLTFAVTDRLELGAGVRFTDETLRLSVRDSACGTGGCLAGAGAPNRQDFRIWTPRASASFRLTDAVTLFAEGARGYRPGGWNVRASTPGALEAYGEETAWTWQGGVASSWLEGRLDAKLTAFALEVDGFQGVMTDLAGGLPQFGQGTLADWRNRGVELELAVRPLDGLSLYANLGLQDAAYRETDAVRASQAACNAGQADACGRGVITAAGAIAEPVGTPDVTLGLGGSFAFAVPTAGIIVTPTADILYRGSQQADTANLAPAIGAHWLVDAGIAIETDDQAWILTFSCRNCLDETAAEQALFGQPYLARPRTLFLAARRRF